MEILSRTEGTILHDMRSQFCFCPRHSSKVLSGDGLVGGNPTMNTPRLRRGRGIYSSFFFTCSGTTSIILLVYFVCDSGYFRVGAMGSNSFLEFSCPDLPLVFLNLLFLGTC